MKNDVSDKLKKINAEERRAIKAVSAKCERARNKLLSKYVFCGNKDKWGYEDLNDHFDFKKNRIVRNECSKKAKLKNCDSWVSKRDIAYLDVECFDSVPVSYDCGYGDCDEVAVSHVIKHYGVCKKCGNMKLLGVEEIADENGHEERSEPWCKMDSAKTFEKIIKDYKKRMNKKLGKTVFDENDASPDELSEVVIKIKVRKKPYLPLERILGR